MIYKFIKLIPSSRQDKKWEIHLQNEQSGKIKRISFGQKNASDFTLHKNLQRKENYILRHQKNEMWSNPLKPGTLSRYILWNKPTIDESLRDYFEDRISQVLSFYKDELDKINRELNTNYYLDGRTLKIKY